MSYWFMTPEQKAEWQRAVEEWAASRIHTDLRRCEITDGLAILRLLDGPEPPPAIGDAIVMISMRLPDHLLLYQWCRTHHVAMPEVERGWWEDCG